MENDLGFLQQKLLMWKGSRKNGKFVDLCFKLGKAYIQAKDRKKALIHFQHGVDTAKEISMKLTFEQMIDYGEVLIQPFDLDQTRRAVDWFLGCHKEMKLRKFHPKQITICEAYVAIAYCKCKNHQKAFEHFSRSLEYKSRSLPSDLLWNFISCGIETMQFLDKQEDLLQFYKLRLQSGISLTDNPEKEVNDLLKLFQIDYEFHSYEDVEQSPYLSAVKKTIKKVIENDPTKFEYLFIEFPIKLLQLGIVTPLIPQMLENFNISKASNLQDRYRFFHCYMDYCHLIGDYEKCAEKAFFAIQYFNEDDDAEFCEGPWCPWYKMADANLSIGKYKEGIQHLQSAFLTSSGTAPHSKQIEIMDKLIRNMILHDGNVYDGENLCNDIDFRVFEGMEEEERKKYLFNPIVRSAQCRRKQGDFHTARKYLKEAEYLSQTFVTIFNGCCYFEETKKWDEADEEFAKLIMKIKRMGHVKKILNENNYELQLFPEDGINFVNRILPVYRKKFKKSPKIKFINQTYCLQNSMQISAAIKRKLFSFGAIL